MSPRHIEPSEESSPSCISNASGPHRTHFPQRFEPIFSTLSDQPEFNLYTRKHILSPPALARVVSGNGACAVALALNNAPRGRESRFLRQVPRVPTGSDISVLHYPCTNRAFVEISKNIWPNLCDPEHLYMIDSGSEARVSVKSRIIDPSLAKGGFNGHKVAGGCGEHRTVDM